MSVPMPFRDQVPGRTSGQYNHHNPMCAPDVKPTSVLFAMLPAIVQTRLPKLHSFRYSVSEFRGRSSRSSSRASLPSSGTSTPMTSYSSRTGSIDVSFSSLRGCETDTIRDDSSTYDRPSSSGSSTLPVYPMTEVESGINWKYANHGSNLLTQAFQESSALDAASDEKTPVFCRDLYVHSLTYLLRGLPSELCQSEVMTLRESMPLSVVESIESTAPKDLVHYPASNCGTTASEPEGPPSLIHQAIASMILQIFVLVQFLLPYVKIFIAAAYRFERENHISERVLAMSIDTIDEVGRRSVSIADRVFTMTDRLLSMNDGKVGQAINDLTVWWVKGVTGGIHQGFREGVVVLRDEARRQTDAANRGKFGEKLE